MDELHYQRQREALAQRWQAARTPEDMREMLHEFARVFQESHHLYTTMIDGYKKIAEDLTATCTRQTAIVTRLTAAVEELTAQRNQLLEDGATAYERGFNEYMLVETQ